MLHVVGTGESKSKANQEGVSKEFMHEEVRRLRKRLHGMNRGIIDPGSKLMKRWDFIIMVALLYTTVITPYEVNQGQHAPADAHPPRLCVMALATRT